MASAPSTTASTDPSPFSLPYAPARFNAGCAFVSEKGLSCPLKHPSFCAIVCKQLNTTYSERSEGNGPMTCPQHVQTDNVRIPSRKGKMLRILNTSPSMAIVLFTPCHPSTTLPLWTDPQGGSHAYAPLDVHPCPPRRCSFPEFALSQQPRVSVVVIRLDQSKMLG